jgi:hypothetical protein
MVNWKSIAVDLLRESQLFAIINLRCHSRLPDDAPRVPQIGTK